MEGTKCQRMTGSGSKPKICESEFKVALFLIGEIKSTIHTWEQVCSTMYSLCFKETFTTRGNSARLKQTLQLNFTLETESYSLVQDNSGLPDVVAVDSYIRMYRCVHQLYATKSCLKSCKEKKRR